MRRRSEGGSPPLLKRLVLGALLLLCVRVSGASAQTELEGIGRLQGDVELLGRIHGTRPPAAYYERLRADPTAFQFHRVWTRRLQGDIGFRSPLDDPALDRPVARAPAIPPPYPTLGFREGGVKGTFRFPVVLGLFADSPSQPPATQETLQRHFFDGPNPTGTIRDYYEQASQRRVDVRGVTFPWVQTELSGGLVAGGTSGLASPARVRDFIVEILEALDASGMDWSAFVNDGPDGVPNSPDDDGHVDLLAVVHPAWGSECGADPQRTRIWSHRFRLSAWGGGPFVTSTPAASGGYVTIDDYIIQPALSCDRESPNEIGVLAHELGHGFGLPDLYGTRTSSSHFGAGNWDLMATGTWGCAGSNPARPCGMGAWSRAMLGWVEVEELLPGTEPIELTVGPSLEDSRVYRLQGEGSRHHLLLENRQRDGFDTQIFSPGLLVWQVDPEKVANGWRSNVVNGDPQRMGVWLREAQGDERLVLPGGGRGDAGNPFPGAAGNQRFHAGSRPSARAWDGDPLGVTLLNITRAGREVRLLASTYSPQVVLQAQGPSPGGFGMNGAQVSGGDRHLFRSAPFQEHVLEARTAAEVAPGTRPRFQGWEGSDSDARILTFMTPLRDTTLVARFGTELEHRIMVRVEGGVDTLAGGEVLVNPQEPEGWFPHGTQLRLEAVPRQGFRFRDWVGDSTLPGGLQNPLEFRVQSPFEIVAFFETAFTVSGPPHPVTLEAGLPARVDLVASSGNLPIRWKLEVGSLPEGLILLPQDGRVQGEPLEVGTFSVQIVGRDAIGLEDRLDLVLEVSPPAVAAEALALVLLREAGGLSQAQRTVLDRLGNGNGRLDVGDLRIFLSNGGG
ncbi:MAG: M6 family metalloprotease domain-containing protein [Gemmatimonadota bacterium]